MELHSEPRRQAKTCLRDEWRWDWGNAAAFFISNFKQRLHSVHFRKRNIITHRHNTFFVIFFIMTNYRLETFGSAGVAVIATPMPYRTRSYMAAEDPVTLGPSLGRARPWPADPSRILESQSFTVHRWLSENLPLTIITWCLPGWASGHGGPVWHWRNILCLCLAWGRLASLRPVPAACNILSSWRFQVWFCF